MVKSKSHGKKYDSTCNSKVLCHNIKYTNVMRNKKALSILVWNVWLKFG